MEYYGTSFWAPTNTLSHHGIKGQKWGVRRWQNEDGTFNEAGKRRYSRYFNSKDTYERIKATRKDERRMSRMTERQKQSLTNAEKYWKARSEGKKPTVKRGLIKRAYDRQRSYSLGGRTKQAAVSTALTTGYTLATKLALEKAGNISLSGVYGSNVALVGKSATNMAIRNAEGMLINELMSIVFGHF